MERFQVKNEICKYVKKNGSASYKEIEWVFNYCGFDWKGEFEIQSAENNNIVYWANWSEDAINLINEMRREKIIKDFPAERFRYFADGGVLRLPIVKQNRTYKTPHWLPIIFIETKERRKKGGEVQIEP